MEQPILNDQDIADLERIKTKLVSAKQYAPAAYIRDLQKFTRLQHEVNRLAKDLNFLEAYPIR